MTEHKAKGATPPEIRDSDQTSYYGVPLNSLFTDAILKCQLYLKMGASGYVKYREPGLEFNSEVRARLRENRHTYIYVRGEESEGILDYLENNMRTVLVDERIHIRKKAEVLYHTTLQVARELIDRTLTRTDLDRSRRVVEHSARLLISQPRVLGNIVDLVASDYQLFTHSVNVMVYTLSLARQLKLPDDDTMVDLGEAALLHDLGKRKIDNAILNKPGPLDDGEFAQMKLHPGYGVEIIAPERSGMESITEYIMHHHEKLDGSGYPDGIKAANLEVQHRILTICDIYDALTTRRVFRKAFRSYPALRIMKESVGKELDDKAFTAFVKLLGSI